MKMPCQLAGRESIRAFYSEGIVLVVATGMAGAGNRIDIDRDVTSSGHLPEFRLVRCPKPGVWPDVMEPYRHGEFFVLTRHPDIVRIAGSIRVHHQDGVDEIPLELLPDELPRHVLAPAPANGRRTATGYSPNLSFDEAFADAVAILGSDDQTQPDRLLEVRVEEAGGLFGGIAGFHHLYVRISAPARRPPDVIAEVGPSRPVVEVGPVRPEPGGGKSEVITEVAPNLPSKPGGEVIVEVAPDRPDLERLEEARRQGPMAEVAPERPESS